MNKFLVVVAFAGLSLNVVAADFRVDSFTQSSGKSITTSSSLGGSVMVKNGSSVGSSSSRKNSAVSHSDSYSKSESLSSYASPASDVPYATKTRCVKKVSRDVTEEVCQVVAISNEEATAIIEAEAQSSRALSQARLR